MKSTKSKTRSASMKKYWLTPEGMKRRKELANKNKSKDFIHKISKSKKDKTNFSLCWTDERRKKQSERLKNNNPSHREDIKEKIRESKLGKKNPKVSEYMKNKWKNDLHYRNIVVESGRTRVVSLESKLKVSGENHYNWQGGTSFEPYPVNFNRDLKLRIKNRDNYICQLCNRIKPNYHIHHIDYDKENCDEKNLITLCNSCHGKVHVNREMWKIWFSIKIEAILGGNAYLV